MSESGEGAVVAADLIIPSRRTASLLVIRLISYAGHAKLRAAAAPTSFEVSCGLITFIQALINDLYVEQRKGNWFLPPTRRKN